jgi:hypothetical protein
MDKPLPTIPVDMALRYNPSNYMCFKCAISQARFFVTNDPLERSTEVVALCFQCYVRKRKWVWRVVRDDNKRILDIA